MSRSERVQIAHGFCAPSSFSLVFLETLVRGRDQHELLDLGSTHRITVEGAQVMPRQLPIGSVAFRLNGYSLALLVFGDEINTKVSTSAIGVVIPEPHLPIL